jgi:hypothetical protein
MTTIHVHHPSSVGYHDGAVKTPKPYATIEIEIESGNVAVFIEDIEVARQLLDAAAQAVAYLRRHTRPECPTSAQEQNFIETGEWCDVEETYDLWRRVSALTRLGSENG